MSSITINNSLAEKAAELEEKAQKAERATNIENRVENARSDIQRVTQELADLEQSINQIQYYSGILTDVFADSQPMAVNDVSSLAIEAVNISDEELLVAADEDKLMDIKDQLDNVEDKVDKTTTSIRTQIRTHVDRWKSDIQSARELDRIISGGNSDFSEILYKMENFLTSEIDNPANNSSALANRWERLKSSWEKEGDKHGWDSFQSEYNIRDSTVKKLRKFTNQKSVSLSEFDIENIEDIKKIDELESAVNLRIGSR